MENLPEQAGILIQRAGRPELLFSLAVYQLRSVFDRFNSYKRRQVNGTLGRNPS